MSLVVQLNRAYTCCDQACNCLNINGDIYRSFHSFCFYDLCGGHESRGSFLGFCCFEPLLFRAPVTSLSKNWVGERESFLDPESSLSMLSSVRGSDVGLLIELLCKNLLSLPCSLPFFPFLSPWAQQMKTTWKKKRESCPMPPLLLQIPMRTCHRLLEILNLRRNERERIPRLLLGPVSQGV
jgi:hypothetical protein